jgi:tetratricopeptide (TPR) repeat protein
LQSPEYVFPFQAEMIKVLHTAIEKNPKDGKAFYYLGNLLYDWQPQESVALWEKSAAIDPDFAITWRNLAIANSHRQDADSQTKAIAGLEKAVSFKNPYPTHFAELDKLYQAAGTPVQKRLGILEKNESTVVKNDEALGSLITLKIFTGKTSDAIKLLQSRTFSIWENSTGFNTGQAWADAHLVQGLQFFNSKKYREAITAFQAALTPPENLRAEQRFDLHSAQLAYWTGCAYAALGETEHAREAWNKVVAANSQGNGAARRGGNNLMQGEQRYFQALSKQKLGLTDNDAQTVFNELVSSGNQGDDSSAQPASRRQSPRVSAAMIHYVAGLGYEGLDNKTKAREEFNAALAQSPDLLVAKIALEKFDK